MISIHSSHIFPLYHKSPNLELLFLSCTKILVTCRFFHPYLKPFFISQQVRIQKRTLETSWKELESPGTPSAVFSLFCNSVVLTFTSELISISNSVYLEFEIKKSIALDQFTKRVKKIWKKTIGPSTFYPFYQKEKIQLSYQSNCLSNCLIILKIFLTNSNMDFVKSIILKSSVDKGRVFGAMLTDVSKMFECLYHELLIAKLNENGFSLRTFIIVHD